MNNKDLRGAPATSYSAFGLVEQNLLVPFALLCVVAAV